MSSALAAPILILVMAVLVLRVISNIIARLTQFIYIQTEVQSDTTIIYVEDKHVLYKRVLSSGI